MRTARPVEAKEEQRGGESRQQNIVSDYNPELTLDEKPPKISTYAMSNVPKNHSTFAYGSLCTKVTPSKAFAV